MFQGYLHTTQTGKYTLSPDLREDNALFFWAREKAYSSYEHNNASEGMSYIEPAGLPHIFDYGTVAGNFLPITFIYANGYGPELDRLTRLRFRMALRIWMIWTFLARRVLIVFFCHSHARCGSAYEGAMSVVRKIFGIRTYTNERNMICFAS